LRISNARDLGHYVRNQRREAGLNQSDLAVRAAVSRRWLSDLEAGKPTVEVGIVLRVLAALGQLVDVRDEPTTGLDLDDYLKRFGGNE